MYVHKTVKTLSDLVNELTIALPHDENDKIYSVYHAFDKSRVITSNADVTAALMEQDLRLEAIFG